MKRKKTTIIGYIVFFILIALIITCAILIYSIVKDKLESNGIIAIIMLAVIAVLALFCTLIDYLRRRFTIDKTVNEVLQATEKIARGDFNIELKAKHSYQSYDNFDLIINNINTMAKELSKNEILKTDFISNVSHEIKTPLAIINNYATLLQDKNLDEETRETYLKNLVQATKRLTDLVTNILKLNKLENQVIREQKSEVLLSNFIGEIILGFESQIEEKEIELNCDLDDITANVDKTFIEIICNNLFSNALKFTDKKGVINVSLKQENNIISLIVSDNGCGMNKETGEHILDKFYQGDTSHAKEGNGLGLALVKRVIDIMGGEILVSSELNKGSTFTIKWKN